MHVERFESALWHTTSLLLIADGEAVVVDPCIDDAEVARLDGRARELGARVTHVLATHADWDHVCGIAAFPDAESAMGELTTRAVESGAPAELIAKRAVEHGLEIAGAPRVDRALATGRAHRVGPFTVETLAVPGHTADGTAFRVRALGLLAVGDYLSAVEFPFVSSTAAYRMTLAGLIELLCHDPPDRVVPGHGPPHTAGEALTIAEADLAYLRELRAAVAGALEGGDDRVRAQEAGLAVDPPRRASDGSDDMHAANVETQLAELLPP